MKRLLLTSLISITLLNCAAKQGQTQHSGMEDLDLSAKRVHTKKTKPQAKGKAFTFDESSVQGYMDSPTPYYITDADRSVQTTENFTLPTHTAQWKTKTLGSTSPQKISREEQRLIEELKMLQDGNTSNKFIHAGFISPDEFTTEEMAHIEENSYNTVATDPLSTVSIDVDNASYTNLRRFINQGRKPYANSIRIEECINYFDYDYPEPRGKHPFATYTEVATCPWDANKKLLHIGLKGKSLFADAIPQNNLVFLLDVSGSMSDKDKLPLLKQSLPLLIEKLNKDDRVSIVVYASASGVVLPATKGSDKESILAAIDNLSAGGSTAGGQGIQLAYKIAEQNFIKNGNNRIILATDGDFNVGISSTSELVTLIKEKRQKGIALTVLGFGTGNYKDSRMEQIADKGNGNYFYIDNILEAKKVLVTDMMSTLHTIAKDVKLQIEFNPARVSQYRLVGYVNRKMANADFNDDTKDAGELGAGHTVTALYEIIPAGKESPKEELKYQETTIKKSAQESNELATLKLRYKKPDSDTSILVETGITDEQGSFEKASETFRFSTTVAEFAMKLNGSLAMKERSWKDLEKQARASKGKDNHGYRAELISLIEKAELLP